MQNTQPTILVIFGGTGDLARRKLFKALLDLFNKKLLPNNFKVIGFSRKDLSGKDYQDFVAHALIEKNPELTPESLQDFLNQFKYVRGDINIADTYEALSKSMRTIDAEWQTCANKLFYVAVPPNLYETVFRNISLADLATACVIEGKDGQKSWTRILVEKPFGNDLLQAKKLDKLLGSLFDERQIFRIDHYLAKESIQQILTFRFANAIFEPLWNYENIEKVEIYLHETLDVDERASFYDSIGALKDVGQNHLLQMLALVAMEDPGGMRVDNLHKARLDVLSRLIPFGRRIEDYAFRAQYKGYTENSNSAKDSNTETFFEIKLGVNNRRWRGVPFILRAGKALNESLSEIKIYFKEKPSFVCISEDACSYNNVLTFKIQPQQGISICFWTKAPGLVFNLEQKELSFAYNEKDAMFSDPYEKVLFDCFRGDQTLFPSTHEVMAEWNIISSVVDKWQALPLVQYERGVSAEEIININKNK